VWLRGLSTHHAGLWTRAIHRSVGSYCGFSAGPHRGRVILLGKSAGISSARAFTAGYREAMLVGTALAVAGALASLVPKAKTGRASLLGTGGYPSALSQAACACGGWGHASPSCEEGLSPTEACSLGWSERRLSRCHQRHPTRREAPFPGALQLRRHPPGGGRLPSRVFGSKRKRAHRLGARGRMMTALTAYRVCADQTHSATATLL